MIAFGPIPSRRLGQSLGVNNIPPKSCSFDCIYCQVGPTRSTSIERRKFYEPIDVYLAVKQKVEAVIKKGGHIDYLSIVPDGEPTLDIHLGDIIDLLRPLNINIAVICNSSLIWREDVREELAKADLVSLKFDAADEAIWRKHNRPHGELSLKKIMDGALVFAKKYKGTLITETMLAKGVNDTESNLKGVADYLRKLQPDTAYLAVATRPPTEKWVESPDEATLNMAYQVFSKRINHVETLLGFSSDPYASSNSPLEELLNITAVHPMREVEVLDFINRSGLEKTALDDLIKKDKLVRILHGDQPFYIRKFTQGKVAK